MNEFIAFSGGVDSTALALLEPDIQPIFTDTLWEFPELYHQIERFERVTERSVIRVTHPKFSNGLPQYIRQYCYLPSHGARFCTRVFKIDSMNFFYRDKGPTSLHIALRADELDRTGNLTRLPGLEIKYPLQERGFTRKDCVALCEEHNLLPHYPVYMMRGGCKGCFYKRKSEVLAMTRLVPSIIDELQELEEYVQRERQEFFHMFPNIGMSIAAFRQQPELFDFTDLYKDTYDDSDKGLYCGLFCHK